MDVKAETEKIRELAQLSINVNEENKDALLEKKGIELFTNIIMNAGDAEAELEEVINSMLGRDSAFDDPLLEVVKEIIDGIKEMKNGNEEMIAFFSSAFKQVTQ